MPTAATGTDVSAPYTTEALVARWLPPNYKTTQIAGAGPSNVAGKVSVDDIADLINRRSRALDGVLWQAGVQTPFPAATAANPVLPAQVCDIVSYRVASDITAIMKIGQRQSPNVKKFEERAQAIQDAIVKDPHVLGKVQVRTAEDFRAQMGGTREAGFMFGVWHRLANRNIDPRSVRFVRSDGKEALRPDAIPFLFGVDWSVISAAEGTLAIANTMIFSAIDATGTPGGVIYQYGWVRLDRFITRVPGLPGVSR